MRILAIAALLVGVSIAARSTAPLHAAPRAARLLVLLLAFVYSLTPLAAQGARAIFRSTTDVVVVPVTVTDAMGRFVTGLSSQDFTVIEDGRERPIRGFVLERTPVGVAVLIDISGSMSQERFEYSKAALVDLTESLEPDDEVAVATVNDATDIRVGWTTDKALAARALDGARAKWKHSPFQGDRR